MAIELKYDERFAGAKAVAVKDGAQAMSSIVSSGTVGSYAKNDYTYCTGYYIDKGDYIYPQTTYGWYLIVDLNDPDWSFSTGAIKAPSYTQSQAQALVQKIINNNKDITRCNMLCARYADRFSQTQLAQIKALQQRVMARNKALQDQGLTQNVKTGYPEEYAELSPYLAKIMEDQSIGIATWVVVVIAATVIAATATAAYFAYKSLADESERDVKFSKELTATLVNKLTPEEYQQLFNETKGMLTKSKIKSLVKGSWGTLKYVIMGGAALYAFYLLKSDRS